MRPRGTAQDLPSSSIALPRGAFAQAHREGHVDFTRIPETNNSLTPSSFGALQDKYDEKIRQISPWYLY